MCNVTPGEIVPTEDKQQCLTSEPYVISVRLKDFVNIQPNNLIYNLDHKYIKSILKKIIRTACVSITKRKRRPFCIKGFNFENTVYTSVMSSITFCFDAVSVPEKEN